MSLTNLPPELLHIIASILYDGSPKSNHFKTCLDAHGGSSSVFHDEDCLDSGLIALSLTCKYVRQSILPVLFRELRSTGVDPFLGLVNSTKNENEGSQVVSLVKTLHVRFSFYILHEAHNNIPKMWTTYLSILTNLTTLIFSGTLIVPSFLKALASGKSLRHLYLSGFSEKAIDLEIPALSDLQLESAFFSPSTIEHGHESNLKPIRPLQSVLAGRTCKSLKSLMVKGQLSSSEYGYDLSRPLKYLGLIIPDNVTFAALQELVVGPRICLGTPSLPGLEGLLKRGSYFPALEILEFWGPEPNKPTEVDCGVLSFPFPRLRFLVGNFPISWTFNFGSEALQNLTCLDVHVEEHGLMEQLRRSFEICSRLTNLQITWSNPSQRPSLVRLANFIACHNSLELLKIWIDGDDSTIDDQPIEYAVWHGCFKSEC